MQYHLLKPLNSKAIEKPKLIGYQVESRDGRHEIPDHLHSWEVFRDERAAAACIMDEPNPKLWAIFPVFEGDIEYYDFV